MSGVAQTLGRAGEEVGGRRVWCVCPVFPPLAPAPMGGCRRAAAVALRRRDRGTPQAGVRPGPAPRAMPELQSGCPVPGTEPALRFALAVTFLSECANTLKSEVNGGGAVPVASVGSGPVSVLLRFSCVRLRSRLCLARDGEFGLHVQEFWFFAAACGLSEYITPVLVQAEAWLLRFPRQFRKLGSVAKAVRTSPQGLFLLGHPPFQTSCNY